MGFVHTVPKITGTKRSLQCQARSKRLDLGFTVKRERGLVDVMHKLGYAFPMIELSIFPRT